MEIPHQPELLSEELAGPPGLPFLEDMTVEQLRTEAKKSRELIENLGAVYFAVAMIGEGSLPPKYSIPTDWLRQCHEFMEGCNLHEDVLGAIRADTPEDVYSSVFVDKAKHTWLFLSGDDINKLHTDSGIKDPTQIPVEVRLWFQSVCLALGLEGKPVSLDLATFEENGADTKSVVMEVPEITPEPSNDGPSSSISIAE